MPTNYQLLARQLNVDQFLSEVTLGIPPDQVLIGDMILPVLPSDLAHAKIAKFDNSAFVAVEDEVGDRGAVKRLDMSKDTVTVDIEGHALAAEVSMREQEAAANMAVPYDLLTEEMYNVKQAMLLHREELQATLVQNSGIYGSNVTDLAASTPNGQLDVDGDDPLRVFKQIIARPFPHACGRPPSAMTISSDCWAKLIGHPTVQARLFGANSPQPFPLEVQVATILGIPKVIVGGAVTRIADGTPSDIWKNFVALHFIPPTTGRRIPAFGYTLEQRVFNGASEMVTKEFDSSRGPAGVWVAKRGTYYTPSVLFASAGWIFTNPLATPTT